MFLMAQPIYLSMFLMLSMTCIFLSVIRRDVEYRLSELEVLCLNFDKNRKKLSSMEQYLKMKSKLQQFIQFYSDSIQWVIILFLSELIQPIIFLIFFLRLTIRCNSVFNEMCIGFFYFISVVFCCGLLLTHVVCVIDLFLYISPLPHSSDSNYSNVFRYPSF